MNWQTILKQETIEEYVRDKGYEKVDENNGEPIFENEGGEKITITLNYPRRGGSFVYFPVKHDYGRRLRILEQTEDLVDAYEGTVEVITAPREVIEQMAEDFSIPETEEISDAFNYRRTKMGMIRLPPMGE
jgi:hypothetical protein